MTPASALHPELDQRLARLEAVTGQVFELVRAWADEAQALRERQLRVERELAEERERARRLSQRLARVEREADTPTEPSGLAPLPDPEHVT
ncbi:MAG: hypothetical protein HYZ29_23385 [Myxococcales bacterium]|nr:hypothetical protein [Myxococcales bacterium]